MNVKTFQMIHISCFSQGKVVTYIKEDFLSQNEVQQNIIKTFGVNFELLRTGKLRNWLSLIFV